MPSLCSGSWSARIEVMSGPSPEYVSGSDGSTLRISQSLHTMAAQGASLATA